MARKKVIISIPRGSAEKIAHEVGCSIMTVWGALAYRSDSETAKRVREVAISNYGGIETEKAV